MKPKKVGKNSWMIKLNKVIYPKHSIMETYAKFSEKIKVEIKKEDEKSIDLVINAPNEKDVLEFVNAILTEIKEVI